MPNSIAYSPIRLSKSKQIGKLKNTGMLFQLVMNLDLLTTKSYYNDSNRFLTTSTTGYVQSGYDLSPYLTSNQEFNSGLLNNFNKPFLLEYVRPFNMAPIANAQIDMAESIDLVTNDVIKIAFISNYAAATTTYRLASDVAYTNSISWNITGSSINLGTAGNPFYLTISYLKLGLGTQTGTPILTNLIRSRFISINSTAVNKVAPIMSYGANNLSSFAGEIISWMACCLDLYKLSRKLGTAVIKCGGSEIGEEAIDDAFEFEFEMMEESPNLMAIASGTYTKIQSNEVWEQLTGYEVGNITNKVLADVVGTPTRGQIQLATGLNLANLQLDCANIEFIPYFTGLETNANIHLGTGTASYDPTTGLVYFNTQNIGELPQICAWRNKDLVTIIPTPLQLGHIGRIMVVDQSREGKKVYYDLKKVQLKFPESSTEDTGHKLSFKTKVYFSKAGDVKIMYDL